MLYYPDEDLVARTDYLGNVACVIIMGIPSGWPSGVDYVWWIRVYQGQDPDTIPLNYGESFGDRVITINHQGNISVSRGEQLRLEDGSDFRLRR